jgi:hypothetical protein
MLLIKKNHINLLDQSIFIKTQCKMLKREAYDCCPYFLMIFFFF